MQETSLNEGHYVWVRGKKKTPTSHESDDLFVQGERVSTVASIQREGFFSAGEWRELEVEFR